jgi:hypothetical protein
MTKALVVLCGAILTIGVPVVANAQSAGKCTAIVQSLKSGAANIGSGANAYWGHRTNFVNYIYGPLRLTAHNAQQLAAQQQTQAGPLKAAMPNQLASFKNMVATARSQNCLSPAQLSALAEPAIKLAKHVNFDQFPPMEDIEDSTEPDPPEMPH